MKFMRTISPLLLLIIAYTALAVKISNKDIPPSHHVIDRTSDPTLHHVIRRNPTITVVQKTAPISSSSSDSSVMSFGNNNDNNGPNVGVPVLGKSPEIVNPGIYVHNRGQMSVIQESPVQAGVRTERTVLTSLNKATGKEISYF